MHNEINLTVNGNSPFTFQWYVNDTAIAGQTQSTFQKASITVADTGRYHLKVTDRFNKVSLSKSMKLLVTGSAAVPGTPQNQLLKFFNNNPVRINQSFIQLFNANGLQLSHEESLSTAQDAGGMNYVTPNTVVNMSLNGIGFVGNVTDIQYAHFTSLTDFDGIVRLTATHSANTVTFAYPG